jgi:hypothetical protein
MQVSFEGQHPRAHPYDFSPEKLKDGAICLESRQAQSLADVGYGERLASDSKQVENVNCARIQPTKLSLKDSADHLGWMPFGGRCFVRRMDRNQGVVPTFVKVPEESLDQMGIAPRKRQQRSRVRQRRSIQFQAKCVDQLLTLVWLHRIQKEAVIPVQAEVKGVFMYRRAVTSF